MNITNFVRKMIAGGAIAFGAIGVAALAPSLLAHAATTPPPSATTSTAPAATATVTSTVSANPARLARLHQAEQKIQATQQKRLDNTGKVISTTQSFIDKQTGLGKDTSALVTALNTYKAAVATAQTEHTAAQTVLTAHAGFDSNGNVTDPTLARTTVQTAGQSQREFHLTMNQAAFDLRTQILLWRVINREWRVI
jgi:hypothetical protein